MRVEKWQNDKTRRHSRGTGRCHFLSPFSSAIEGKSSLWGCYEVEETRKLAARGSGLISHFYQLYFFRTNERTVRISLFSPFVNWAAQATRNEKRLRFVINFCNLSKRVQLFRIFFTAQSISPIPSSHYHHHRH